MENYERTMQLIEVAQDSAGRSSEQFAKYADSVENKVNRLKNTWEQFRINLVDEKMIKGALDSLNQFLAKFSKVKLPQIAGIVVWGATIGRQLIQGIIQGLRDGSNLISSFIENIKLKATTGSTKIQLQTNLKEIAAEVDQIKAKLAEFTVYKNFPIFGEFHGALATVEDLESELNLLGLTIDGTNTKFTFVDFTTENYKNTLEALKNSGKITEDEFNKLTLVIQNNRDALTQANSGAATYRNRLNELANTAAKTAKQLQSARNLSVIGNAIGSAIGTMAMMAFTGTFSGEQIAKTIGIQLLSSGAMTAINAATSAMGRQAGQTFGAAFAASSGIVGLAIAVTGGLLALIIPKIIEWRKEQKLLNDTVYQSQINYKKATEAAEEAAEALDEQKKKFDELVEKEKDVNKVRNTFEELSQKVILTEEEQQELTSATQELASIMPELVSHYDAQGNAIIEINDNYREQIKLLKETVTLEEKKTALANLSAVQENIEKQEAGHNQAAQEINKAGSIVFSEWDNGLVNKEYSLFTDFDLVFKKIADRNSNRAENSYRMSSELEQTLLNAYNKVLNTSYEDIKQIDILNWDSIKDNEIIKNRILNELKTSVLEYVKENSELDKEYFDSYFEYEQKKIEQQKELSKGLSTLYTSMFKEELLKYDDSERKGVMTSIFNNMLLNDADVINKYEQKKKEVDGRALTEEELRGLVNTDAMKQIAKEVENLTPQLYESLNYFYDNLSALTSTELNELIEKFSQYTYIYENLQTLVNQTNTQKFNQVQKYAQKYNQGSYRYNGSQKEFVPDEYLTTLRLNNSAVIVDQVLSKADEIAEKKGAWAGRRYIEAFNQTLGNETESIKNFLVNQDWSAIDPIHEESQLKGIAARMVDAGLVSTIEEAKGKISNFVDEAGRGILGIHTSLETIGDVQAVKETATKGFNLFQDNADAFTILFAAKPDQESIEVTQTEFKKLWDTIDKLNKDKDSPYHIDFRKYFSATEDGKFVIKDLQDFIKELREPIKGLEQLEALLSELEYKIANSTGSEQEGFRAMYNEVSETVTLLLSANAYIENFTENARKAVTTFRDIEKSISSIASDYQSIVSEQEDKGFLSSKSLEGFLSNIETLNEQLDKTSLSNKKLDVNSILTRNEKGFQVSTAALRNYIVALIQATYATKGLNEEDEHLQQRLQAILDDLNAFEAERLKKAQEEALEAAKKKEEELQKAAEDAQKAMEDAQKAAEDAQKDADEAKEKIKEAEKALQDAQDKVNEKYKDIEEKQKKVIELQDKLNELLYGTGDRRKSTLDGLYNYEQRLSVISNNLEDVKNNLEDINNINLSGSVYEYGVLMHGRKATLMSQQSVYSNNLSAIKSEISPYAEYFTEINGRLLADVAKINAAQMNDKYKDWLESQISAYNDSVDKIHDIKNEIESVEKEFADFQKTYRDKYISLQETVIDTLKEQAEEEINTTKEKYAAIEQADNDYIAALEEAIKKQRELRQQEQDINDLSQKEKKLSLLHRDTSGTRQKDILKQQKDVEKARQTLTDKNVDNIIKNLKELYADQKKARDAEIKYQEEVLNNAVYIEEANAIIQSWGTADEMIGWFIDHNQKTQEMTAEQLEKYSDELAEMYNAREIYMTISMKNFSEMLNVQQAEIDQISSETAEHLTNEAHRTFMTIQKEVDDAIEAARQDLDEAMNALRGAKNELVELLDDVKLKIDAVKQANLDSAAAADKAKAANDALAASIDALDLAEKKYEEGQRAREQIENNPQQTVPDTGGNGNYSTINDKQLTTSTSTTIKNAIEEIGAVPVIGTVINEINDPKTNSDKEALKAFIRENKNKKSFGIPSQYKNKQDYETLQYILSTKTFKSELGYSSGYINTALGTINLDATPPSGLKVENLLKFAKGGLVNYTGPAWVDGTPAQPEAFLSAEDTRNIARFTDVLSSLYNSFGQFNPTATPTNETIINVTVNVDGVSSDYDVDQAIERVKQSIVDAANQTGSTVILHQ